MTQDPSDPPLPPAPAEGSDSDSDEDKEMRRLPNHIKWPEYDRWGKRIRRGKTGYLRPPYIDATMWSVNFTRKARAEAFLEYRDELLKAASRKSSSSSSSADPAPAVPAVPARGDDPACGNAPGSPLPQHTMVEFCCGEESLLGRKEIAKDCRAIRVTEKNDVTTRSGAKFAFNAVRTAGAGLLWASLPCTGGCPWQNVNMKLSDEVSDRVMDLRRQCQQIWYTFERAALLLHHQGDVWPSSGPRCAFTGNGGRSRR